MKRILLFAVFAAFLLVACTAQNSVSDTPSIGDIVRHPAAYEGKTVTVNVTYYGWTHPSYLKCENEPKMMARSDAMIAEDSYCMFMAGGDVVSHEGNLSDQFTPQPMVIRASVKLVDGKPVLEQVK